MRSHDLETSFDNFGKESLDCIKHCLNNFDLNFGYAVKIFIAREISRKVIINFVCQLKLLDKATAITLKVALATIIRQERINTSQSFPFPINPNIVLVSVVCQYKVSPDLAETVSLTAPTFARGTLVLVCHRYSQLPKDLAEEKQKRKSCTKGYKPFLKMKIYSRVDRSLRARNILKQVFASVSTAHSVNNLTRSY